MNRPIHFRLMLDATEIQVSGTVVRAIHGGELNVYGVASDPTPIAVQDAIATWCFQHPFGPAFDLTTPADAAVPRRVAA